MTEKVEKRIPVDCYSRVVGFYAPVRRWNVGKQQEFKERVTYDPRKMMEGADERG